MDLAERRPEHGQRHPWETARATFYLRLLDRLGVLGTTRRWLDAGAGDAWFTAQLAAVLPEGREVVGWDPYYTPEDLQAPTGEGFVLTAERPQERFDGILLLDVIEHVEDDRGFVRSLVEESLATGGWVLVGVPAYQSLFSAHDRALRHYRRYSPAELRRALEDAGLRIETRGGLFHLLLPARAAMTMRERRGRQSVSEEGVGAWDGGPRRTRAIVAALELEGRLSLAWAGRRLPPVPGLSTWAFCRRAGEGSA